MNLDPNAPLTVLEAGIGLIAAATAAVALLTRRRATGVVTFLTLGFLLAIVYALLGAPDVALAEAAIGSGVTGVLLVYAITRREAAPPRAARTDRPVTPAGALAILTAVGFTLALGSVLAPFARGEVGPGAATTAGGAAGEHLAESGVDHPVTGVLLNFRALDTFLEIVVLLAAVVVVLNLAAPPGRSRAGTAPPARTRPVSGAVVWFVRLVGPLLILVAAWFLFAGSSSPGGAFQSGAVIAAILVLLSLAGYRTLDLDGRAVRWVAVAAVATFGAVAVGTLLASGVWLELPTQGAGAIIIAVESVLALVIGASLAVAFLGLREVSRDQR